MEMITVDSKNQFLKTGLEPFLKGELEGIIQLNAPVLNPLADRRMLAMLLEMSLEEVENLLYFRSLAVTDPGETGLQTGEILEQAKCAQMKREGISCGFLGGAEGLEFLINRIDTEAVLQKAMITEMVQMQVLRDDNEYEDRTGFTEEVEEEPAEGYEERYAPYWERQRVLRTLQQARRIQDAAAYIRENAERLFLQKIVLVPPEIRPVLLRTLQHIPKAVLDLEWLYVRVIEKNRRLGKVRELGVPVVIQWYEQKCLQKEVEKLITGGMRDGGAADVKPGTRNWLWSLRDLVLQEIRLM